MASINLHKKILPSSVEVGGNFFTIKTDFRAWLDFIDAIKNPDLTWKDFEYLFIGKVPQDQTSGMKALLDFAFPRKELPRPITSDDTTVLLDYSIDADLIFSAFMQVYHIDLLETDMHWYKFKALLDGITGTKLNEIIQIRGYKKTSKTYDQQMQENKRAWQITTEMTLTEEEKRILDAFDKQSK